MKKALFLLVFSALASLPLIAESTTNERLSKEVATATSLVTADFTIEVNCDNGNWSATAAANNSGAANNVWYLYATSVSGATTGGTLIYTTTGGLSATFGWLDLSRHYYIRHYSEVSGLVIETSLAVPDFTANATLTYVFQNRSGEVKDNFCYGEEVYLDPAGTSNYDRFFMSVWRRPNDGSGDFELYGDYGWTYTNNIGILNLSQMFRSKGENPGEIFEPGYVYELQFAIANPQNCIPWMELKRQFRVVCCEDFFSAYFGLDLVDGSGGLELWAHSFGDYGSYAKHKWLVLSSPNPDGGPYTYVSQSFSPGPGPIRLYDHGVSGLYYFVVHRVSTLCGDYCYGKQREGINYQATSGIDGGEEGNDCEVCGEIDCSIVDNLCFPPGNLRIYGTHGGHLTAYWDAVPGATQYVVEVTINDPNCCERGGQPITRVYYTTGLGQYLGILDDYCLSIRVGAICSDGDIQWTDILCLSGDNLAGPGGEDRLATPNKGEPDPELVVYPNPANKMLSILIPQGKTAELVQFLDIQGQVVFEQQKPDQRLEIDSSALPAGIYAIHVIYTDRSQSVHKVQISH